MARCAKLHLPRFTSPALLGDLDLHQVAHGTGHHVLLVLEMVVVLVGLPATSVTRACSCAWGLLRNHQVFVIWGLSNGSPRPARAGPSWGRIAGLQDAEISHSTLRLSRVHTHTYVRVYTRACVHIQTIKTRRCPPNPLPSPSTSPPAGGAASDAALGVVAATGCSPCKDMQGRAADPDTRAGDRLGRGAPRHPHDPAQPNHTFYHHIDDDA